MAGIERGVRGEGEGLSFGNASYTSLYEESVIDVW